MKPSSLERWLRQPQAIWLRRALFQIHLWTGIAVGIYIFLISVSGSVLVFRSELHRVFTRPPLTVVPAETRLSDDELKSIASKSYPGWTVDQMWPTKTPDAAAEIWLVRDGKHKQRAFNPYTGEDLGHPEPLGVRAILWLVGLHDHLLFDEAGRKANGIGAILLTVLCFTGAVIWWPGISKWRYSLSAAWSGNWRRWNWGLHSAVGFWTFMFTLIWAISAIYLAFPEPFGELVDYIEPLNEEAPQARWGDAILQWTTRLHFGRFAGWPVKALWTVIGFAPVLLFITGMVMWWNRVVRPARQNLG